MTLTARLAALALVALTAVPALAQKSRESQWIATWATALVARAQGQGGPGAGRGQAPVSPPATPAAQPDSQVAAPTPPSGGPATVQPVAPGPLGSGRGGFPAPV